MIIGIDESWMERVTCPHVAAGKFALTARKAHQRRSVQESDSTKVMQDALDPLVPQGATTGMPQNHECESHQKMKNRKHRLIMPFLW